MAAKEFYFGVMLVDDDPVIVNQHGFLLGNRDFRKQTPGRLYSMLKDTGLIHKDVNLDTMIDKKRWPLREDMRDILIVNPHVQGEFRVEPDIAYTATEAMRIWDRVKPDYLTQTLERFGCYIAIVDHDMPEITGLELAQKWRNLQDKAYQMPLIVFYTGKAPLLEEALTKEGYVDDLASISKTGLAEAVLQKGASNEEFNMLMWGLLEKRVRELAGSFRK